jgi:mRNA-degrading endonuclease RelE of RelBE toxin-antitoxin system
MKVYFKPSFVRKLKKLDPALQREAKSKIELLKDKKNHKMLEVHKLKGRLFDFYSFSVNYKDRVVFEYENENEAVLLSIGDHDVYK